MRPRSIYDVMAAIGCFAVLATGTAYAANTVFSTDIVDGEVKSVDIGNNEIGSSDIKDNSINTFDVHSFIGEDVIDGTLTGADLANTSSLGSLDIHEESLLFNNTLNSNDIGAQAVGSEEVANDSLGGGDINESNLNMPPTTTATFAGATTTVDATDGFKKINSKVLPAGAYAVVATVNMDVFAGGSGTLTRTAICELRNGANVIGGATDRRMRQGGDSVFRSMSMNGGAQVPAGGEVSVWCQTQEFRETTYSQMMFIRLDGFF
jgi:hypothetical protein